MNKFLSEIAEQPQALRRTLEFYGDGDGAGSLKAIGDLYNTGKYDKILFTGMGSSYFVSQAAASLFNTLGFTAFALNTSELLYYNLPLITASTMLVCISQSGESIEIVKLLEVLPAAISCIGVSNEAASTLAKRSSHLLLVKAGKEEMTSTKTFTSITMLLAIMGWSMAGKWGADKRSLLSAMIGDFEKILQDGAAAEFGVSDFFGDIEFLQFIGRGPSISTACQSELMFKEAVKTASAGSLGGEFRHGPMEMVQRGFKSVLFAAEGITYQQSIKMAVDIAKYKGKVVVITNKDPEIKDPNVKTIVFNQPDEYLFSIESILPVQLLVNHLALKKGLTPGDFVNGGKVTLSE